jgi:hypothetical protein
MLTVLITTREPLNSHPNYKLYTVSTTSTPVTAFCFIYKLIPVQNNQHVSFRMFHLVIRSNVKGTEWYTVRQAYIH